MTGYHALIGLALAQAAASLHLALGPQPEAWLVSLPSLPPALVTQVVPTAPAPSALRQVRWREIPL